MTSFYPVSILTLCGALVFLSTGCKNAQSQATTPSADTTVQVAEKAPDALGTWLAGATPPTVVQCSVERSTAPEAVDRFNALSERIGSLYAMVHQEAQNAAAATDQGDVALDSVLSKAAEKLTVDNADWKTTAQTMVLANYQEMMQEIEDHRKLLMDYTDSLRTDGSITNLATRLEQSKVLFQLGNDSTELGRQLKDAYEGVSAIRARRITTALGK